MKYKFLYDENEVINILINDNSLIYTSENVLIDTLDNAIKFFNLLNINIEKIEEYQKENML